MFRGIISGIMWTLLLVGMLSLTFNVQPVNAELSATVDIHPRALNLRSRGKWITCFIELPEGYDVADIDIATILLNDTIPVKPHPNAVGDHDEDGVSDLMVKFDRAEVTSLITDSINSIEERFTQITLRITGELEDGTPFEGSDTLKSIQPRIPNSARFWKFAETLETSATY